MIADIYKDILIEENETLTAVLKTSRSVLIDKVKLICLQKQYFVFRSQSYPSTKLI